MIKIISFVDSFKYFEEPIKEFLKRLGKDIELVKLKPSKKSSESEIINEETSILNKILEKEKGYKVLLYIDSKILSTNEFFKLIEDKQMKYSNIIFIVGGIYGINYEIIKDNINVKLSLSKMTFTHIEAIMILLEQIYRIKSIKKGTKYHH